MEDGLIRGRIAPATPVEGGVMARYEREFVGMPAEFRDSHGLDPNYRNGYHGMRMLGGYGRAAYGNHRLYHERDLEREGGFPGSRGAARGFQPDDPRLYDPSWEMRDRDHSPYQARRAMHDFDSRSPMYADPKMRGGYDAGYGGGPRPEPAWSPRRFVRPGHPDRGFTDAGYGEHWMRGWTPWDP
jgi:hypothetical protein